MMKQRDIERDASELLALAHVEPADGITIARLCQKLLGSGPQWAPLSSAEATFCVLRGQPRIYVRRGTLPERARWLAAHELAHWYYRRIGHEERDLEERCDRLGAAIVAPRPILCSVLERIGDVRKVAREMSTTQSLIALRIGEATGRSVALIKPASRITRGEPFASWPPPRAKRIRITDEAQRVALMVA